MSFIHLYLLERCHLRIYDLNVHNRYKGIMLQLFLLNIFSLLIIGNGVCIILIIV